MKVKSHVKHFVDLCMAVALLLLMAQALIGEKAHEWIGVSMFVLVAAHNILNFNWYRNLRRGRHTPLRIFQFILNLSIALLLIMQMVSGITMSRYVFAFLHIESGASFARTAHLLCAYWAFALMALHVGLHANMMMAAMRKAAGISESSKVRTITLRLLAALLCVYGVYAFVKRRIGLYMFLQSMFVFFDFEEPLAFFFADYIAIMGMFVCAGHYISGALRKISARKAAGE